MRKWLIPVFSGVLAFCSLAPALLAQAQQADAAVLQNAPIAPVTLVFHTMPHFFRQSMRQTSPYTAIMALIDNSNGADPWYEVILREKATGQQIYYCNSQRTVTALVADGVEAYFVPIEVTTAPDMQSPFRLQFRDSSNRDIRWTFAASPQEISLANTDGFIARPDDFGLVLMHTNHARGVAPSSAISVGSNENVAGEMGLYASDVALVKIQPVTREWNVVSSPSQLRAGEKWVMRDIGGQEGTISIERADGDQFTFNQQNSLGPNYPAMRLNVVRTGDQFGVRSLSIASDPGAFQISFDPPLPLPAAKATDKTIVRFTINASGHNSVAAGSISAIRGFLDEHVIWTFDAPQWAKALHFDTGVIGLFGQAPIKPMTGSAAPPNPARY